MDFKDPDRIIIGIKDNYVKKISKLIYKNFIKSSNSLVFTSIESAEIIKYASNAFLASKIAFINEIARLSDHYGGNINEIKLGMSLDKRIGEHFLNSGIGFGGSCFPKDLDGLIDRFEKIIYQLLYPEQLNNQIMNKLNILQKNFKNSSTKKGRY